MASMSKTALVIIDMQNEYFSGALELVGIEGAASNARRLLDLLRAQGTSSETIPSLI